MRACGSGYLRPRQHAVELHAAMQLQKPGIRNALNNAPAIREMNATSAMSPTQWPAGCAPKTGSVAGYGMRPALAESCAVWLLLLLLRGCELAAVGAGISARGLQELPAKARPSSCYADKMRTTRSSADLSALVLDC